MSEAKLVATYKEYDPNNVFTQLHVCNIGPFRRRIGEESALLFLDIGPLRVQEMGLLLCRYFLLTLSKAP